MTKCILRTYKIHNNYIDIKKQKKSQYNNIQFSQILETFQKKSCSSINLSTSESMKTAKVLNQVIFHGSS